MPEFYWRTREARGERCDRCGRIIHSKVHEVKRRLKKKDMFKKRGRFGVPYFYCDQCYKIEMNRNA